MIMNVEYLIYLFLNDDIHLRKNRDKMYRNLLIVLSRHDSDLNFRLGEFACPICMHLFSQMFFLNTTGCNVCN